MYPALGRKTTTKERERTDAFDDLLLKAIVKIRATRLELFEKATLEKLLRD